MTNQEAYVIATSINIVFINTNITKLCYGFLTSEWTRFTRITPNHPSMNVDCIQNSYTQSERIHNRNHLPIKKSLQIYFNP